MKHLILALIFSSPVYAQSSFEIAERARTEQDWETAIINYEVAAELGNSQATHWLGTFYFDGVGVDANSVLAAKYFHEAANDGVISSMVYLANMRLSGNGVTQDCYAAEEWVVKFSKGPIPEAWSNKIAACKKWLLTRQ